MINSLPRWVWPGAGLLAFLAGMINVTGVLGFTHEAVTHLTGVTTYLGAALAGGKASNVLHLGGILLAFVAGAALCGLLLGVGGMKPGARYDVVLWVESILLAAAVPLLEHRFIAGVFLTCAATGLQNALVAAFSGSLIRTTHLSGLFTDLGILIGQALRGLPTDARRWKLCFSVISGFLGGAVAGAACFHEWSYHTLLIPAGVTALLGMMGSLRRAGHRTSE
jgi:uncharacterized membrane protein YoaK (UPF0700 family)